MEGVGRMTRYSTGSVEETVTVEYSTVKKLALEVDPLGGVGGPIMDWDGYIAVKELSGNNVGYELYSVVGDIEVLEEQGTVSANGEVLIVLEKTLRYRLYLQSVTTGEAKIGYRLNYYTCPNP